MPNANSNANPPGGWGATAVITWVYRWLVGLLIIAGLFATYRVHPAYIFSVGYAVVLLLVVLFIHRLVASGSAWGYSLWTLLMSVIAIPCLVAGIPHSRTVTAHRGQAIEIYHLHQPGSQWWLGMGSLHALLALIALLEFLAVLAARRTSGHTRQNRRQDRPKRRDRWRSTLI